jgi:hypothetical protein
MGLIQLLFETMQPCRELAMRFASAVNPQIIVTGRVFDEIRGWTLRCNLESTAAQPSKFTNRGCTGLNPDKDGKPASPYG